VTKPEGRRPLVRPRSWWEDDIKIDLREKGDVVWTGLILPVAGSCEHGKDPSGSMKCLEILE
jgi:hypothetical protein